MNRVELRHIPLKAPDRFFGLRKGLPPALLMGFLLAFLLVLARLCLSVSSFAQARWPEGLLLVLATATTLLSLTRQLPGQNVLLASLVVVLTAGAVESLNSIVGIPLGPCVHGERIGRQLFYVLPWPVPLIWLVTLLNSRGLARLALRPWRQGRNYGWWLLALTVLLTVLFDFGLQPFATKVEHYWSWKPTRLPTDWYGAPWVSFLGRGVAMLLLAAFVTPLLLNKKPVRPPPDYHSVVVWSSLNLLFFTSAVAGHLWTAAVFVGLGTPLASGLAIRGAR